jgi:hypothetical protein
MEAPKGVSKSLLLGAAVAFLILTIYWTFHADPGFWEPNEQKPASFVSFAKNFQLPTSFDEEVQAAKAKAEVKGAHGGEIFVAVKRRAYDGPRPFSGNGSTSDVSQKLYPRGAEQLVCKKWAVLTTIFGPTELVKQLVGMKDWCVVVVGDKKVRGGEINFSATIFVLGCNIL